MISNSGHDENGKYSNGIAGDQTGQEWAIINWYSRPWTCILRHPDASVREKIADLGERAAKNDKIGYDQNQRGTYWTQLKAVGYDPSKITTACEADCSAGVIANVKAVGYLLGNSALQNLSASYTGDMKAGFKKAGFQVLTAKKYLESDAYLLRGDILLNEGHHTATNLTNGSKAEVSSDSTSTTTTTKTVTASKSASKKDASLAGTYTVTTLLNMRDGAGTTNKVLTTLPANTKVQNYGYYSEVSGVKWLYVQTTLNGVKYTGFCSSAYLRK